MTEDRSQQWKDDAHVDIDLGGGRMMTVIKPDAHVFIMAGMDPLCFDVNVTEKKRGAKLQKELERVQKAGHDTLQEFMTDILKVTMVNPKLWTGDHLETPAGHVHVRHLKEEAEVLFIKVFEMAGFLTAEAAAKAVAMFRVDTNGTDGEQVGGTVGSEAVTDSPPKSD